MKFLLNANVSPYLSPFIEKDGHRCRHVFDIGKASAEDIEIVSIAKKNEEIIFTHDLDYGTILAFSGDTKPSVIIFRIHQISAEIFYEFLHNHWDIIETPLKEGAIVVFEKENIRIRKLPIKK